MLSNEPIKYAVYARKSSESEDKQIQSIERQIDELLVLQQREKIKIAVDPIMESKSAFKIGREGFAELVRLTEKGTVNAWLCWHANRLSRNSVDAGMVIYLMDMGKLLHVKTPSRTYYNTPMDKWLLSFELIMSKKDSDDKSGFVKSGLEKRYKKGFPSGKAPIGYLNDKSEEKGNRGWIEDHSRLKKIKQIFQRFLKGNDSISSITIFAQTIGLRTAKGKRQGGILIGRSQLERLLKNPIYAGFFYAPDQYGRSKTKRMLSSSVKSIISEQDHQKVITILSRGSSPRTQTHTPVYSGLISSKDGGFIGTDVKCQLICDCKNKFAYRNKSRCPKCSVAIVSMKEPKYLSYTYYYNVGKRKQKDTKAKCIAEKQVTEYLINYFLENFHLTSETLCWAKKSIEFLRKQETGNQATVKKASNVEIARLEAKKSRVLDLFIDEKLEEEVYKARTTLIEEKIDKMTNLKQAPTDWLNVCDNVLDWTLEFLYIMENGQDESKKELLEVFRSNLVWDEQNLAVHNTRWLESFCGILKMGHADNEPFEPEINPIKKGSQPNFDTQCPTMRHTRDDVRTKTHLPSKSFEPRINPTKKGSQPDFDTLCPTMRHWWDEVRISINEHVPEDSPFREGFSFQKDNSDEKR